MGGGQTLYDRKSLTTICNRKRADSIAFCLKHRLSGDFLCIIAQPAKPSNTETCDAPVAADRRDVFWYFPGRCSSIFLPAERAKRSRGGCAPHRASSPMQQEPDNATRTIALKAVWSEATRTKPGNAIRRIAFKAVWREATKVKGLCENSDVGIPKWEESNHAF
jgi:hypothetical protein